jgi:hypothetical protein
MKKKIANKKGKSLNRREEEKRMSIHFNNKFMLKKYTLPAIFEKF